LVGLVEDLMVERRAESSRKVISKRTVWGRQGFSKGTLVEVMQMSVASNEATGGMIADPEVLAVMPLPAE
jgi:hypothetical protein